MSFYLNGYVLRPARVAPGNAPSTGEALTGVDRGHCLPQEHGHELSTTRPVQVAADMYRAAVLERPDRASEEYLIWAAVTAPYATAPGGSATFITNGDPDYVAPITGTLTVDGTYEDGTDRFIVRDAGGRDIGSVSSITIKKGDQVVPVTLTSDGGEIGFDAATAILTLDSTVVLGGGFSLERGDSILAIWYSVSPATFWWTRNDPNTLRFGWNGRPTAGCPTPDPAHGNSDPSPQTPPTP